MLWIRHTVFLVKILILYSYIFFFFREKLNYATMIFVRVAIAMDMTVQLKKAVTIAVR